jgi:hypothetical protein
MAQVSSRVNKARRRILSKTSALPIQRQGQGLQIEEIGIALSIPSFRGIYNAIAP